MFETTKQKLYNNVFQLVFSLWIQPSLGKKKCLLQRLLTTNNHRQDLFKPAIIGALVKMELRWFPVKMPQKQNMISHYLVGGFNHLEKYESQWEGLFHI